MRGKDRGRAIRGVVRVPASPSGWLSGWWELDPVPVTRLFSATRARLACLEGPDAMQALLDDLGARIAAERRKHGLPEPDPIMDAIRRDADWIAEAFAARFATQLDRLL